MDSVMMQKFFDALDDVINADGSFGDKVAAIKDAAGASDRDGTNLEEFLSWFEQ